MTRIRQEWDLLRVGETFGPYRYEVRPDVVDAYRTAIGDEEIDTIDGETVAPAMLLTFPFLQMIEAKYEPPPGVIHAEQEFDLCAPVRVGAVLTCTGTLTAMFLRRDRRYYTVTSEAADERDVLVARSRTTAVYPEIDLRNASD
jgi:acyl dehydratase